MAAGCPYNITMSFPRFYCPTALAPATTLDLPEHAAAHAVRALRLREGDALILFDGTGGEHQARITGIERKRVTVTLLGWHAIERECPIRLTLIQALQSGEKMDLTVQKSVELGIARIVPVTSQRSVLRLCGERAERRLAHWRGIAVSACEQCGRNTLPRIEAITHLRHWLSTPSPGENLRLLLDPGSAHTLDSISPPPPGGAVELLIGAEGGLAPEEVQDAREAGYTGIRLGPRILRTETAGLAVLAAIQGLWGDFRKGGDHV